MKANFRINKFWNQAPSITIHCIFSTPDNGDWMTCIIQLVFFCISTLLFNPYSKLLIKPYRDMFIIQTIYLWVSLRFASIVRFFFFNWFDIPANPRSIKSTFVSFPYVVLLVVAYFIIWSNDLSFIYWNVIKRFSNL